MSKKPIQPPVKVDRMLLKCLAEMMQDRGFTFFEISLQDSSYQNHLDELENVNIFHNTIIDIAGRDEELDKLKKSGLKNRPNVSVMFVTIDSDNNSISPMFDKYSNAPIRQLLFIGTFSTGLSKTIAESARTNAIKFYVQKLETNQLLCCPGSHMMSPKIVKVYEANSSELFEWRKHNLQSQKSLKRRLYTDAFIVWHGISPGDMILVEKLGSNVETVIEAAIVV